MGVSVLLNTDSVYLHMCENEYFPRSVCRPVYTHCLAGSDIKVAYIKLKINKHGSHL